MSRPRGSLAEVAGATSPPADPPIRRLLLPRIPRRGAGSSRAVLSLVPSTSHELPLLLLRESPRAAASLVREALGIELGDAMFAASTSFAELSPSTYAADLVLVGIVVVVIEVQRTRNRKKRRSWPLYLASAHAMHEKPTWLVVIALDPKVAAWARQPIESFHGGVLAPLVIGPEQVPRIVDAELASRVPELAVLSALAHGREPGGEDVGVAALIAASVVGQRDEDRAKLYADAVMHALGDAAREALEAKMKAQGYEYQSDFARKYVAEGREVGREEGREAGREEGREEGREVGREEGLRIAVRLACELLGLEWTDERAQAIDALDAAHLDVLCETIRRERRWPI